MRTVRPLGTVECTLSSHPKTPPSDHRDSMLHALEQARGCHLGVLCRAYHYGTDTLDALTMQIFEKVIPPFLRPLDNDERRIASSLQHGDLGHANAAVIADTHDAWMLKMSARSRVPFISSLAYLPRYLVTQWLKLLWHISRCLGGSPNGKCSLISTGVMCHHIPLRI